MPSNFQLATARAMEAAQNEFHDCVRLVRRPKTVWNDYAESCNEHYLITSHHMQSGAGSGSGSGAGAGSSTFDWVLELLGFGMSQRRGELAQAFVEEKPRTVVHARCRWRQRYFSVAAMVGQVRDAEFQPAAMARAPEQAAHTLPYCITAAIVVLDRTKFKF